MLNLLNELIKPITYYKSVKKHNSVFHAISNSYYHENFHSDILAFYLSSNLPKRKLIDWLNRDIENQDDKISYQDYKNGEVNREKNRIDITLFNSKGNRAIIIENKSNGAYDQYRQLYRYYDRLKSQGIKVEKICYLNKDSKKNPDLSSLTSAEALEIKNFLKVSYLVGEGSICEEVLKKVIIETDNMRINSLSKEIISLFEYVVYGDVNMSNLKNFVEDLNKNDNKKKLEKIIQAYNDVPKYLAYKYKDYITSKNCDLNIWVCKDSCLVIDDINYKNKNYAFDIWFSTSEVDISFLVRNGDGHDEDNFRFSIINNLPFSSERIDGRYRFILPNPLDKQEIKSFIDNLLKTVTK